MSCNNYDNCVMNEMENLKYPVDRESLYGSRFYDDQTANNRCYSKNPIRFVEGFGFKLTWENILKTLVIILLVALFVIMAKDFVLKKEIKVNLPHFSELKLSPFSWGKTATS